MKTDYECLVIGAGPAGGTAAALLAERGYETLLIEREKMPRVCVGESLMPETYWTLQRLGVLERMQNSHFVKKNGVQFVSHTGKESQPFFFDRHDPRECATTWHVERAAFDHMLFENAADKGADCRDQTRLIDVDLGDATNPHQARLRGSDGQDIVTSARVIVDATGQQAFLANRLGLREDNPALHKASIWGHFRGAQRRPEDEPEVTTILHTQGKHAWFWYIPLSSDTVSVGLVGDNETLLKNRGAPQSIFDEELHNCPVVAKRLANAEQVNSLHVVKEFSYSTRQHAGDGWVLVGDAYGFIDPVYSSGVFLALRSGELAADAIHEGFLKNDLSGRQIGCWTEDFDAGVTLFRRLVGAFYTKEFSFAAFLKEHPHHSPNLVDLLIGRAFQENAEKIFEDLQPALDSARRST